MKDSMHPRDAFLQLLDLASIMADNAVQVAETKKKLFDAYIAQGFSRAEALELVKSTGI